MIEKVATALGAVAMVAFAAAALLADGREPAQSHVTPAAKPVTAIVRAERTTVPEPATATVPQTEVSDLRYVVKRGDTLWDIAARNYENVTLGMRRIKKRNHLRRDAVLAGEVLVLPAQGRRVLERPVSLDREPA